MGEKKGFWGKLVSGLAKTRDNIRAGVDSLFYGASEIDDDFYEQLEEQLIMADMGIHTTDSVLEKLRKSVSKQHLTKASDCRELLISIIAEEMKTDEKAYEFEHQKSVILVIGVNGVGKTTSIGKLAAQLKSNGKKVMLAAADTFRAAAIEQLTEWAHRAQVDIIAQKEGSDPAAVVFDAVNAAKARNADVLICDTAGRLHNKKNLMDELAKINRVINRELPESSIETLLVLDAATGQNAVNQAREFKNVTNITGIVLTKLDGTAKGGIIIPIKNELKIPVKYVGVGEGIDDLQPFSATEFVNGIFDEDK